MKRTILCAAAFLSQMSLVPALAQGRAAPLMPVEGGAPGAAGYDIVIGGGAHQHILYSAPARPRGSIVMLPGGAGDVGIESDGDVRHGDNFVVRTRTMWTARGYAVVIPDTIDRANLRGSRSSAAYADVVARLISFAHSHAPGPVFLLGTSQGSIAAMNGAAHARPGSVAGVVLTESVSVQGGSHETVFDADPQDVRIPALIVANRDDACRAAPPADAVRIKQSMTRSPDARIAYVGGGVTRSDNACGSLTPHGYFGIEPRVVAVIASWLQAHA